MLDRIFFVLGTLLLIGVAFPLAMEILFELLIGESP
jgi:hypothetical protein